MRKFGLIGKKLSHSFSASYFKSKFDKEQITDATYENIELENISEITEVFKLGYDGFNVTIPYKVSVIPYIPNLDPSAREIGAVNCIKHFNGQYIGFNTDWIGFKKSCLAFIGNDHCITNALILGDGGASKAVEFALKKMGIAYQIASRKSEYFNIHKLENADLRKFQLIINTTPVGMYPEINSCITLPYAKMDANIYLYDLIYNPEETLFLKKGKQSGAWIKNGLDMLILQAEEAWKIWNNLIE